MSNEDTTRDQLRRMCEGIADDLAWLAQHAGEIAGVDFDPEEFEGRTLDDFTSEPDEPVSLYSWLEVWALDVQVHWRGGLGTRGDDLEITHVIVVTTIGGPHIEVTTEDGGKVRGWWGSDRYEAMISDHGWFAEQMMELAEEVGR